MNGILIYPGLEAAFLGIADRCAMHPVAVYDTALAIAALEADGMDHDEAVEFFDFNIAGGYLGERTPLLLRRCTIEELEQMVEDDAAEEDTPT